MKPLTPKKLKKLCDNERLKRIQESNNSISPQYTTTGLHDLADFSPFLSIMKQGVEALKKKKSFARVKCKSKQKIIDAFIACSKTSENSFNIRKKHHILEFEQSKLSNFLIAMIGTVHNCINNVLYDCYYITAIDQGPEVFIAIEKNSPNHIRDIKDKLNKHHLFEKFEFYGDNFSQVYNFAVDFISYVNSQKDDSLRDFIPKNYSIVENEDYQAYKEKQEQEASNESSTKQHATPQPTNIIDHPDQSIKWYANGVLKNYEYKLDVYSKIMSFLSLSNAQKMLSLLGYFISNSMPQLSENRSHFSLALVSENQTHTKRLCDILFKIVLNEEKHTAIPFDPAKKIKHYFKLCSQLPVISTTEDFNKADRQKLSDSLEDYYENKPKKLKEAVIILTKKEIANAHLHRIELDILDPTDFEKTIIDLKKDTSFKDTVRDFLSYIQNRYTDETISHFQDNLIKENNIESTRAELLKREKELSCGSQLACEEVIFYAPIVYFLEEYFRFLSETKAISEEQCFSLSNHLKKLYSNITEETTPSLDVQTILPEEISKTLLRCIVKAYKSNLFNTLSSKDNAFFATSIDGTDLLCFQHQQESPLKHIVKFLEDIGMEEEIADIKELTLQKEVGTELKRLWKESKILHCPSGFLYPTREGKVLAIICKKLEEHF